MREIRQSGSEGGAGSHIPAPTPMCESNTMNSASESLRPERSVQRAAAEGNCVVARRGGEQPEAETQSTTEVPTSVNPFRPAIPASLLAKGEASDSGNAVGLFGPHPTSKGGNRGVEGGWGWNERKGAWLMIESHMGGRRRPPCGSQSIHSSEEAGNVRGAKGCRKVNAK